MLDWLTSLDENHNESDLIAFDVGEAEFSFLYDEDHFPLLPYDPVVPCPSTMSDTSSDLSLPNCYNQSIQTLEHTFDEDMLFQELDQISLLSEEDMSPKPQSQLNDELDYLTSLSDITDDSSLPDLETTLTI